MPNFLSCLLGPHMCYFLLKVLKVYFILFTFMPATCQFSLDLGFCDLCIFFMFDFIFIGYLNIILIPLPFFSKEIYLSYI